MTRSQLVLPLRIGACLAALIAAAGVAHGNPMSGPIVGDNPGLTLTGDVTVVLVGNDEADATNVNSADPAITYPQHGGATGEVMMTMPFVDTNPACQPPYYASNNQGLIMPLRFGDQPDECKCSPAYAFTPGLDPRYGAYPVCPTDTEILFSDTLTNQWLSSIETVVLHLGWIVDGVFYDSDARDGLDFDFFNSEPGPPVDSGNVAQTPRAVLSDTPPVATDVPISEIERAGEDLIFFTFGSGGTNTAELTYAVDVPYQPLSFATVRDGKGTTRINIPFFEINPQGEEEDGLGKPEAWALRQYVGPSWSVHTGNPANPNLRTSYQDFSAKKGLNVLGRINLNRKAVVEGFLSEKELADLKDNKTDFDAQNVVLHCGCFSNLDIAIGETIGCQMKVSMMSDANRTLGDNSVGNNFFRTGMVSFTDRFDVEIVGIENRAGRNQSKLIGLIDEIVIFEGEDIPPDLPSIPADPNEEPDPQEFYDRDFRILGGTLSGTADMRVQVLDRGSDLACLHSADFVVLGEVEIEFCDERTGVPAECRADTDSEILAVDGNSRFSFSLRRFQTVDARIGDSPES